MSCQHSPSCGQSAMSSARLSTHHPVPARPPPWPLGSGPSRGWKVPQGQQTAPQLPAARHALARPPVADQAVIRLRDPRRESAEAPWPSSAPPAPTTWSTWTSAPPDPRPLRPPSPTSCMCPGAAGGKALPSPRPTCRHQPGSVWGPPAQGGGWGNGPRAPRQSPAVPVSCCCWHWQRGGQEGSAGIARSLIRVCPPAMEATWSWVSGLRPLPCRAAWLGLRLVEGCSGLQHWVSRFWEKQWEPGWGFSRALEGQVHSRGTTKQEPGRPLGGPSDSSRGIAQAPGVPPPGWAEGGGTCSQDPAQEGECQRRAAGHAVAGAEAAEHP